MLENLKKELLSFVNDLHDNLKDKEDILYATERTSKLVDVILDEIEKIMEFKEDKISAVIRKQEIADERLNELKERLDNVYEDIYDDEYDDTFDISCPYCGNEFEAYIEEESNEIKCPECGNHIELDWEGNLDDDQDGGCNGSCSGCGGCKNE